MKALRSIAEVECELRGEGFFEGGADGLVADLYLGYGLSRALRRDARPQPPGALPTAACGGARAARDEPLPRTGPYHVGDWERTWDESSYAAAVEAVREAIAAGDVYQVNLVQHLSAPFGGDPAGLAAALAPLRPLEPRPFAGEAWTVVSASPELFLARRGSRIWTRPIKGTRPLGQTARTRRFAQGRRRARHDRRPRAQRPLTRLRARQHPLA